MFRNPFRNRVPVSAANSTEAGGVLSEPASAQPAIREIPNISAEDRSTPYSFPPLNLIPPCLSNIDIYRNETNEIANKIGVLFREAGVPATLETVLAGPLATAYSFGCRLDANIASSELISEITKTVESQQTKVIIKDREKVGVEFIVGHKTPSCAYLRSIFESEEWSKGGLVPLAIGVAPAGSSIVEDLTECGNVIITGIPKSGKTTVLRSCLLSILYSRSPEIVRTIIVSSDKSELAAAALTPHSLLPIIDRRNLLPVLGWLRREIEARHIILMNAGMVDIIAFNSRGQVGTSISTSEEPRLLPHLIVILDEPFIETEVATVSGEITDLIQSAAIAGVHFLIATSKVSAVTSLIGSEPERFSIVAHRLMSRNDSVAVLNIGGAERLTNKGRFLFTRARRGRDPSAAGFIYVMVNDSIPGMVKIGRTGFTPKERAKELSGTSVPTAFRVEYEVAVSNAIAAEQMVHRALAEYRTNADREFFALPVEAAIQGVEDAARQYPRALNPLSETLGGVSVVEAANNELLEQVRAYLSRNGPPGYAQDVYNEIEREADRDDNWEDYEAEDGSQLYQQALEVLKTTRRASTSMLQRRLRIGYHRAQQIMEIMEDKGIVGPENGSSPREILVDLDSLSP